MSEYEEFPPYQYFLSVLKSCPGSALLYVDLWKNKNEDCTYKIMKHDSINEFLMSKTMLRGKLIPLVGLGLISMRDHPEYYKIELVDYDFDFQENNESS